LSQAYAEVIGDPIAHSKSPLIHRFWLAKLGIAADYRACHVRPDALASYFAGRRQERDWRGCNITVPHKVAAMRWVDEVDAEAQAVGAINTVVAGDRLTGHNTDVTGIREALAGVLDGSSFDDLLTGAVQVIGSGGAARAAGAAFRGSRLSFFNRSLEKAERLADEFSGGKGAAASLDQLAPPGQERCVLVNASSLGMSGNPEVPVDLARYPADTIVFDMVYAPLETGLLHAARQRGLRTIDGLAMLIGQAAAAFALFFGQPAPRQHDAELRELLTA
jgi:shikimate dehydrogenase